MSELVGVFRRRAAELIRHEPQPEVSYAEVLIVDEPIPTRWKIVALALGGALLGVLTFYVLGPVVIYLLVGLFWLVGGMPGEFGTFLAASARFELPAGMAATNLGLATLIPISFALVVVLHHFHPRWLHSVQPGFRWRFALVSLLAGFVVLAGVWVLTRWGQPWMFSPERDWAWFLVAILLTSPLQAAAEEYFFRGYLVQALHTAAPQSPWFGVVGAAAAFAVLHGTQNLPAFLYRFAFGILAGVLVVKTGGLEAGIAAHVVNNVLAYGYAVASGQVAEVHAQTQIGWIDLAWGLAGFAAFAAVAVGIARRMKVATTTPKARFVGVAPV